MSCLQGSFTGTTGPLFTLKSCSADFSAEDPHRADRLETCGTSDTSKNLPMSCGTSGEVIELTWLQAGIIASHDFDGCVFTQLGVPFTPLHRNARVSICSAREGIDIRVSVEKGIRTVSIERGTPIRARRLHHRDGVLGGHRDDGRHHRSPFSPSSYPTHLPSHGHSAWSTVE